MGKAATANRREEYAQATRDALIGAALELFAERGYAAVGTEEIVKRARVTRGALYHHFRDKRDLFRAVHERVEQDLVEQVAAKMDGVSDPWEVMLTGTRAFLDACEMGPVKQIALSDAPAVLGWQEWREIDGRYGLGLIRAALTMAIDAGVLRQVPVEEISHLLLAAMAESAFVVANAEDPAATREQIEASLFALIEGLRT